MAEGNHTGDILIDGSYDGSGVAAWAQCQYVVNGYCQPGYEQIHFNLSQWGSNSSATWQKNNALHEMGHALGLDHSCDTNAVMAGPQSNCPNNPYNCGSGNNSCPLKPTQDDINGLNVLYQYTPPPNCGAAAPLPAAPAALPSPGQVLGNIEYEVDQTAAKVVGTHPTLPGPLGRC